MADESSTRIDTADVLAVDATVARSTGSRDFGVTRDGFVAKPFARLLAEKLALARGLFGDDLDISSGSAIRKLLEISALEDARTWAALASIYDNAFIPSAVGEGLSRLGQELGLPRPFLEAHGRVKLKLAGKLPPGIAQIAIPRGARLSSPGGHHAATDESVVLSAAAPERIVAMVAFFPGPEHNLNPTQADGAGQFPQKLDRFNRLDPAVKALDDAEKAAGAILVTIEHTEPFTGGELQWPDDRYRQLLLRAPRSIWTVDAIRIATSLVPGVRQVQVRDEFGGLDINQSIFGNFNFIERVFGSERDIASPYYFTVLVAPTPGAIWDGPDGLRASVESAIEDLRPIGIFPQVQLAEQIGIGVEGKLVTQGIPLPSGSQANVNASQAATDLKKRLLQRLQLYIDGLQFGDPVRASEVIWTVMNEPGIVDLREAKLLKFPPGFDAIDLQTGANLTGVQKFDCGNNVTLQANQIAVFVDDATGLTIV
jgi:hypothetical protein